ncbi:hypothetical protein [Sinomonas gamaensis]|nr:hypothetical protein [Sinomonas gamaensis]
MPRVAVVAQGFAVGAADDNPLATALAARLLAPVAALADRCALLVAG